MGGFCVSVCWWVVFCVWLCCWDVWWSVCWRVWARCSSGGGAVGLLWWMGVVKVGLCGGLGLWGFGMACWELGFLRGVEVCLSCVVGVVMWSVFWGVGMVCGERLASVLCEEVGWFGGLGGWEELGAVLRLLIVVGLVGCGGVVGDQVV